MQISKKSVLDTVRFFVEDFRRYAGQETFFDDVDFPVALQLLRVHYSTARDAIHGIDLCFSGQFDFSKIALIESDESVLEELDSIFDEHIKRVLKRFEDRLTNDQKPVDTVSSVASECLGSNGIGEDSEVTNLVSFPDPLEQVDWTADEQITESDYSEVGCLDIPVVLSTTPAKPSLKSPGEIFIAHIWSMYCRPKRSRISRLPQEYDYTGCFRYSINRGLGISRAG